jgi:hypothetical protein
MQLICTENTSYGHWNGNVPAMKQIRFVQQPFCSMAYLAEATESCVAVHVDFDVRLRFWQSVLSTTEERPSYAFINIV